MGNNQPPARALQTRMSPTNKLMAKHPTNQSSMHNLSSSEYSVPTPLKHCEEDVSSSHVETEKRNMSINPSLTYSVAGVSRDVQKQQTQAKEESNKVRSEDEPLKSAEKPNLPKTSKKVKPGSSGAYLTHNGGPAMRQSVNVSFGSMSESLNARFLYKKPSHSNSSVALEMLPPSNSYKHIEEAKRMHK